MTTITVNPSASNHDAWQGTAGAITLTGEVRVASGIAWGGLLLPSVAVPAGATINSATLYYQASATTHDDPGQTWYAQAADDAGVFTTTTSDISSRPRTTASVADAATGIGNTTYRSVDVTGPLAEVFGRTGWASGNDAALLADNTGGDLWIRSYDGGTGIWYVTIVYTSGMNGAATLTTGADLTGADLTGAGLAGANLTGADLTDADLTDASLFEADLTDAVLAGADLTGADLGGAVWSNTTCPNGAVQSTPCPQ